MKYCFDEKYWTDCFKTLVATPSPVGFYQKLKPVLEEMAMPYGQMTYDNKHTAYLTLEGEENSKSVMIAAHADTLGMMVRHIDSNGMIRVSCLGGVHLGNTESKTVTVHTRDGGEYTGMLICQSHSTHVFGDARSLERSDKTMYVLLDEVVKTAEDVKALGIENGCYISIDPNCEITPNGYIKSRYVDNKASIACVFAVLKYMKDHGLKPKYTTVFSFSYGEEVGNGSNFVPQGISEVIAVDMALTGPELAGDERKVSIITRDLYAAFSYELVNSLIDKAKKAECAYVTDVYAGAGNGAGTDAGNALKNGNDVKVAGFGMGVYNSHSRERTHMDGILNTAGLLLAYILDI